ncbi:PadR family transcriptional regulator [Marinilactibacillus sp. GCM10026970]|uniref:PadR family transcriptional regulator n=1 Tax=Marinilactibacillus sp. GCM10026970 TaxID=3252642 RepID=UPI003613B710
MSESINKDYIRGHIDTIILRILLEQDNYGYEIIKSIKILSNGNYELKEPSLYTSLKRLEKLAYIESYWGDETHGGRRKYYKVTKAGNQYYINALKEWKIAKTLIDQLVEGTS